MIVVAEDKVLKITYGALAASIFVIIAFAGWLTSIELRGQANAATMQEMKETSSKVEDYLRSIDKRLSRIEVMLENK